MRCEDKTDLNRMKLGLCKPHFIVYLIRIICKLSGGKIKELNRTKSKIILKTLDVQVQC